MRIWMLTGRLTGQEFEVGESERPLVASGVAELVERPSPPEADRVAESPAGRADGDDDDERLEDAQSES